MHVPVCTHVMVTAGRLGVDSSHGCLGKKQLSEHIIVADQNMLLLLVGQSRGGRSSMDRLALSVVPPMIYCFMDKSIDHAAQTCIRHVPRQRWKALVETVLMRYCAGVCPMPLDIEPKHPTCIAGRL